MQSLPKKSLLPFTEEHEAFRKEFGEFLDREIGPYYMDMAGALIGASAVMGIALSLI